MLRKRIIPFLLLRDGVVVKGQRFANHEYVGDPINIVRLFSNKPVDEIALVSIDKPLRLEFLRRVASECFIPFSVGGHIRDFKQASDTIMAGAERVILNSAMLENTLLVKQIAQNFGNQCVLCCIDLRQERGKYVVYGENGSRRSDIDLVELIYLLQENGAGEILLQLIEREGTFSGLDANLLKNVKEHVSVPLGITGGANDKSDIISAFLSGADAVYAGSMLIFRNSNRMSILVNVPDRKDIDNAYVQKMCNG